jgi:DUF1680 family protein
MRSRVLPPAVGAALAALSLMPKPSVAQQSPAGLAKPGTSVAADRMTPLPVSAQPHLGGLLGNRFALSASARLLNVDEEELLAGYRHKPGKHPWIGEHVGKWLHAASLSSANLRDARLRAKLDRVATGLIAAQEPDGYLGTYVPEKRFGQYPDADWDVWSHKYCLIGLLSYYQATGSQPALDACRRVGDLLISTFGPGMRSIISAGTHLGMAATSVLEPVLLLYRATGDRRYLAFAEYIVSAWEEPGGPHILSSLRKYRTVRRVANGKAYEMLSNLAGLCELYRVTGHRAYLDAVLTAWDDIRRNRLYITGSGSSGEVWQDDHHLPNGESSNICETCVTVSWLQLNLHLLRITGESRFADQIERTAYNHLLGAQKPTCDAWAYYTPLEGRKPYGSDTNCCLSSGPRGVALLPSAAFATTRDALVVNLFTPSTVTAMLPNGAALSVSEETGYPFSDTVVFTIASVRAATPLALRVRRPAWATSASLSVNGRRWPANVAADGYLEIRRVWRRGDRVVYRLGIPTRLVLGDHTNAGKAAVMVGPVVLAADEGHNSTLRPISRVALASPAPAGFSIKRQAGSGKAEVVFETAAKSRGGREGKLGATKLRLISFYAAGGDRSRLVVWLPKSIASAGASSLFAFADESRSRQGNQYGSIVDEDPGTIHVTFDGTLQDEAWFAVSLPHPVTINHIWFAHGHSFHDGGWFDSSRGRPRVQVRRTADGPWEAVGLLESYPATTADRIPALRDGQRFTVSVPEMAVFAVRVVGAPSCGDNAAQSFSSCGELGAALVR